MASKMDSMLRKREREIFLERALDFDEIYRQALARVQFMKTRYKKAFEPDDPEYTLYARAKRNASKFEYSQRKMNECEEIMKSSPDKETYEKADKDYERYMKNCLYYAFGIGQLYSIFLEKAPNGLI